MAEPGKFPQQRIGVFVDIQNMYYSARAIHGKKVNFKNVLEHAVGGRQLVRALAYGITTEEAHEGEFHEALGKQGFELKSKPLQTFVGGQKKGDWDVGIAMDILRLGPKIDVAVLVSGDGDFVPLVEYARDQGLRIELISFKESTSHALIEVVDSYIDMSADPKTFLIGSRTSPRGEASRGRTPRII